MRRGAADISGSPRRDHRSGRPQDDHQRAQLGRQRLHGRLRGRQHADLGQQHPGPDQPARRGPAPIDYISPEGKAYQLNDKTATLMVRPRGWHLAEKHVLVDGEPVSGGAVRFRALLLPQRHGALARGTGPYFYLPKMESHLEARLWNDVFILAQDELGIPRGHDQGHGADRDHPRRLRDGRDPLRAARAFGGLNCGRWDYIFSCIKKFRHDRDFCLADAAQVTMTTHFMQQLLAAASRPATGATSTPWAAWRRRSRSRTTRRPTSRRWPGARRQGARGQRRPRRHLGGAPGLVPMAMEVFDGSCPSPTRSSASARGRAVTRRRSACLRAGATDHRGGPAPQHQRRHPVIGAWLRGQGACRSTT